jgi:ribonuclease P protein component, eubacterial
MKNNPKTLNRNHLFSRAYRSKLCFVSPFVVTYIVRKRRGDLHVGITASKKVGGAVQRNRARRIVKAAAYELLRGTNGSVDVVFVCRRAALTKKSTFLKKIIREHLVKAGVLENTRA